MADDWQEMMDAAGVIASANGLEFHELRNAWSHKYVEENASFFEGHGVTASDGNHFLYDAVKHSTMELARFAADLGDKRAERNRIVGEIAASSGQAPELVLQQLREFFAPVDPTGIDCHEAYESAGDLA